MGQRAVRRSVTFAFQPHHLLIAFTVGVFVGVVLALYVIGGVAQ